ncbi:MAG: hypothetical protein CBC35_00305 [Planctomycetes bacterium TMED75]|nr:hypothetical protein [Planctomycetaceae bacterium]OUU96892.1 MAG: hypothetical protein CBC35_00305 [Planctomycetes bacterium TMED75]
MMFLELTQDVGRQPSGKDRLPELFRERTIVRGRRGTFMRLTLSEFPVENTTSSRHARSGPRPSTP